MKEISQGAELTQIPIPDLPSVASWKEVPIVENSEPLVPLGPFSDNDGIFTDSIYFGERISSPYIPKPPEGSLATMFVRQSVAEQLKKAEESLPYGMHIVVFDSYRTLEVQGALYDRYYSGLKEKYPDWTDAQLETETQKYVSLPSTDPTRPSPHNTGGAVDVAIFGLSPEVEGRVRELNREIKEAENYWKFAYILEMNKLTLIAKNARMLNFGTPFDWGEQEAALDYFERQAKERLLTPDEQTQMKSRRFLYRVMRDAGFEAYPDEWWHYNSPKSQMGAKTAGLDLAEFGVADLSAENLTHEQMRKGHHLGTRKIFEGAQPSGKLGPSEYFTIVRDSVAQTGDIRETSLPLAEIIAPKR